MLANLLYAIALTLLSPVILYRMIRHGRYRRGIGQKLLGLSPDRAMQISQGQPCLWIHAVSVGEVNLLPGIVRRLEEELPYAIAISTSTDTGYDLAVKHFGESRVFFCQLDFSWAVRRTLRNLNPALLILAELELWPNLIRQADRRGCEVMIINGRLSERSAAGYQRFARMTQAIFRRLQWVGCQDESSRDRFDACGTPADRLEVTGSLKFDDAPTSREVPEVQSRVRWAGVTRAQRVWIVGSTQQGEERMAIEIYQSLRDQHPELRLILVPRHKERFEGVADLISSFGLNVLRRSSGESPDDFQWDPNTVILVDTIGELRHWWGVGEIATVGGSFGSRGGQNMLERAGYGCAVSFGHNTRNFREIAERLIAGGGAVRVNDQPELQRFVLQCLDDESYSDALGRAASHVVLQHRGATERTITALRNEIET